MKGIAFGVMKGLCLATVVGANMIMIAGTIKYAVEEMYD